MKILKQTSVILDRCRSHTEERFRLRLNDEKAVLLERILELFEDTLSQAEELKGAARISFLLTHFNITKDEAKKMSE